MHPTAAAKTPAPASPKAPAATGRTHTVQKGDTLSKISQQYYGNRSRVKDIFNANRGIMSSETDLKIGTVLKIP